MGYTHYFEQVKPATDEQWKVFIKDAKKIIKHIQEKLKISLISNDENNVIVNNERINLNGGNDLDHETFLLKKYNKGFNFCKTAQKPYDIAVCSLLLLAHHHIPGSYMIDSDGKINDWKDSMELNAEVFEYAFIIPKKIDNSEQVYSFEEELETKIHNAKELKIQKDCAEDVHKISAFKKMI